MRWESLKNVPERRISLNKIQRINDKDRDIMVNIQNYENVVAYGIGEYFEKRKREINEALKIDYVCDKKWENSGINSYDGVPIITREELLKLENTLVVITVEHKTLIESIKQGLEGMELEIIHVDELVGVKKHIVLTGVELKKNYPNGEYEDDRSNKICFDLLLSDSVRIVLAGGNNSLVIGRDVLTDHLTLEFGDNGKCSIGDNTVIGSLTCYISNAEVSIGKHCLFSHNILFRTHDGHHIFDMTTKERINWSKNIVVGDQVWVGQGVTLLGGAQIGTGSVVGSNAVTSSQFGRNQIIAGAPAKIIRENIIWSRDFTRDFDFASFEECIDKMAVEYL